MMNLLSICFITTGDLKVNASAKRALGMANPLSDLGWKVYILMKDTPENRKRCALECDERTEVFFLTYTSARDERRKKKQIVSQINPQYLYFCALTFRNLVFAPGIKIVEHSELMSSFRSFSWLERFKQWLFEYYSIIYADGLVLASKFLEKKYLARSKSLFKRNIPLLYLPYAFNNITYGKTEEKNHILDKKDGDIFIVYLGTLTKDYGALTMAEAMNEVHEALPNVKLVLCGQGEMYENIKAYVQAHQLQSSIYLMGFIEETEIPQYFSLADAFLLPMKNTTQDWARCPSKLYMYLAYQKPIITCKIGEPFETLKEKGIYYEPDNVKSLANAIQTLVESDNRQLRINVSDYDWAKRSVAFSEWAKSL